jgi:adenosylhomocysteine nucleosidase
MRASPAHDPHAPTAIVSAMAQELEAVLALATDRSVQHHAGRDFHHARLHGHPVVLVLCGIGKVAAATTATLLAERFGVGRLVFTGVAGGLGTAVRVGDVVVAQQLLQHDLDVSPLFPRYVVPMHGRSHFDADPDLTRTLEGVVADLLSRPVTWAGAAAALGLDAPRLHRGLVISGDRFVATAPESRALQQALPEALAVEMEGAALAQVCHELALPFAVLRTVSDRADDSAHVDFMRFLDGVAAQASAAIIGHWLATSA